MKKDKTKILFLYMSLCIIFINLTAGCTKGAPEIGPVPDGVSAVTAELVSMPENMPAESASAKEDFPQIDAYINKWGTGGVYVIKTEEGDRLVSRSGVSPINPRIDYVTISPDGNRVAYTINEGDKMRLVLDGMQGEAFDIIDSPAFTLDSRHIVYKARKEDKWRLVIDDKQGKRRFLIYGDPMVTADGSAIIAVEKKSEGSPFDIVSYDLLLRRKVLKKVDADNIYFSDDLLKVAVIITEGKKKKVIYSSLNTDEIIHDGKLWDNVSKLNFDTDGKHIAYVAKEDGLNYIVLDDMAEPLPEGVFVELPVINAAEMTVASILVKKKVYLHIAFSKEEQPEKMYQDIDYVQFSRDGSRTIFIAENEKRYFLSVNDEEGQGFDMAVSAMLSPDERFIVYRARQDGKRFLVIADADGKTIRKSPYYEMVFPPHFTKDGKSVAYGVKDGRKLLWKVEKLDGF